MLPPRLVPQPTCRVGFAAVPPAFPAPGPAAVRLGLAPAHLHRPFALIDLLAQALDLQGSPTLAPLRAWARPVGPLPLHLHASFRRLSRETNAQCDAFRQAARALVQELGRRQVTHLLVEDVTCSDTPSLLVLAMLCVEADAQALDLTVSLVSPLFGDAPSPAPRAGGEARGLYAQRFVRRLAPLLGASGPSEEVVAAFLSRFATTAPPAVFSGEEAVRRMHHYTAVLAYDLAEQAADEAWHALAPTDAALRAQVRETQLLLALNVFGPQRALALGRPWLAEAHAGQARARLCYFLAVAQAKRALDTDLAEATVREGLQGLDGDASSHARLERGWLRNAQALVGAIRAARHPERGRADAGLRDSVALEHAALEEVAGLADAESAYLRANITTNLVTAHEMLGETAAALALWQTLGAPPAPASLPAESPTAHAYRKGALELAGGRARDAAVTLRGLLEGGADSWTLCWVHFALAVAVHRQGEPVAAKTQLTRMLWAARREQDWGMVALGLLAVQEWRLDLVERRDMAAVAALAAPFGAPAGAVPGPLSPRSKLPANAPHLDLAAPAGFDFTHSLISRALTPGEKGRSS